MKKNMIIFFMILFVETPGFTINGDNPLELLKCYIYVIKRAIEDQKWNIDLTVKDSLCAGYFSAHEFVTDKDTLRVIPNDYSKNKYRLKSFLISDSVAIVQFQIDTVFVNEKGFLGKKHNHKKSGIEFSVVLDSSKETGVRVDFGNSIFLEDKK